MIEDKNFEETIKELEAIVNELEKGDISLDDSLVKFQQGIKLSNHCNKILQEAEKKITLVTEENNEIKEEDFNA